ncbi:hypothetical protein, partial [Enterobacter kobei]
MLLASGYTKKVLAEIRALIENTYLNAAYDKLDDLLDKTQKDERGVSRREGRKRTERGRKKKKRGSERK